MSTRIKVIAALFALYLMGALIPIGSERAKPAHRAPAAQAPTAELPAPIAPVPMRPRPPVPAQARHAPASPAEPYELSVQDAPSVSPAEIIETEESGSAARPEDLAALQQQWERESDDVRGSEAQRASVTTLFEELQLPTELIRDVRCRRSVCRIAVDASNMLQLAGLAERVQQSDPPISFRVQDGQAFAYVPRG